ncbi:MAG: dihydropteroate synthase [Alphaproteobacteria bacterium]
MDRSKRRIGRFSWGARCYVMGVLNVTPDSFSGDGLGTAEGLIGRVVDRAAGFVAAGADILDVGGESTRPGSDPVSVAEELERVVPAIAALAERFPDTVLSVDTSKAPVAAAALDAGAGWVNDVWALKADPLMAPLVAARGVPVVLMHNRSRPKAVESDPRVGSQYVGARYRHLMEDVAADLARLADDAVAAGVGRGRIILDPGIGFGKTVAQNMALLNHLDRLKPLGYPLLIGPSRKSFIGKVLDLGPGERDEGTAACVAIGIARGADIIRVHDVKGAVRVAKMADAIIRSPADGAGGEGGTAA